MVKPCMCVFISARFDSVYRRPWVLALMLWLETNYEHLSAEVYYLSKG
jgi:hypothetical protein